MKSIIIFISELLLLTTFLYSQEIDTTKWNQIISDSLNIKLKIPTYFQESIDDIYYLEECEQKLRRISYEYTWYYSLGSREEAFGEMGDTTQVYLVDESYLDIILCNCKDINIAKCFGYEIKNNKWVDTLMLYHGWLGDDFTEDISFDEWIGFENYTPTSSYYKDGGAFSLACDGLREVYFKHINNKIIYVFAEDFDFDGGEFVLKNILKSIELNY